MSLPSVLLMTTYYVPVMGGVETHARGLAAYLHQTGFPVRVVTKRVARAHAVDDVIDGVPVHRVRPTGERSGRGKWLATPFMLARALADRPAADVIVCIDYRGIGLAAVMAGRLTGRAVVVQAETAGVLASPTGGADDHSGVPPDDRWSRAIKAPIRAVYRLADHFIPIGRDIEREMLGAGVPRDRVHYLPHGVDVERFRPAASPAERTALRAAAGWPLDRIIVLFVGRLSVEMGVLDTLARRTDLGESRPLLVVVGPDMTGHPRDAGVKARAFVREHGLEASVMFQGPSADPAPLFRAADLCAQPSHFEAFGISAIEALASGVPLVASAVGGLRDFLIDGSNALLHPPRSPHELTAVLQRALADPALRQAIARQGRHTAVERFDQRTLFAEFADLIVRAAGKRRDA
jgi:glycosyltransferase involved in cell wall biosynthesis